MERTNIQSYTDSYNPALSVDDSPEETLAWREKLHHVLIEEMSPDAFESLSQRLLRELGFIHVEVTGRTGDGGIDGKGIARINGLVGFHIVFQCKNTRDLLVCQKYEIFEVQLLDAPLGACLLQWGVSPRLQLKKQIAMVWFL